MYTYTVFLVFKKVDKLMNVTRMNMKPGKLSAADKMEKLIVLVGLIVHHFLKKKSKTKPCHILVAFSVGFQLYRFLRSEMGHSLFYFF